MEWTQFCHCFFCKTCEPSILHTRKGSEKQIGLTGVIPTPGTFVWPGNDDFSCNWRGVGFYCLISASNGL